MSIYYERNFQRAFGTFPLSGEVLRQAILAAAEIGYRAFDTAQMYGNEAETGAALRETGIPRDDLCITTKVHPDNYAEDRFLPSVERSLADLGVGQVDVLLLHWPPVGGAIAGPLRLLEKAQRAGLARHVGVSNFNIAMMREAVRIVDVPLVTNQVEFHPLLNQDRLMAGANEVGIPLSSYSSVARGEIFRHPEFAQIGAAYGKSAAQVALRWILQKGVSLNTMSTKPENIRANYEIMDFSLSHVDLARIDRLTQTGYRIAANVPWAPDWD
jgi:2,5-diketo-D-gluconate reductase B